MCDRDPSATALGPDLVCDIRNNLIWNYNWGTTVRQYGTGNVVNNYYYSAAPSAGLSVGEGAIAYVNGNYGPSEPNLNTVGNQATPFAAPTLTQTDAITAAHQIVAQAG